jgi:CheY-like chemotaxis protein
MQANRGGRRKTGTDYGGYFLSETNKSPAMTLKKRILLIDDDSDHLLLCKMILIRRNFDVSTLLGCEELQDVLEAVEIFRPDLIFLDHYMPGHCGLDVAQMLRSTPHYGRIPIIYFSSDEHISELAATAGAVAYLKKPFDISNLVGLAEHYARST